MRVCVRVLFLNDKRKAKKNYSFGFVDVIAIPLTCWFYVVEKFGGFKVEKECPKFSAWMNNCMQRETVARMLPDPEKVTNLLSR